MGTERTNQPKWKRVEIILLPTATLPLEPLLELFHALREKKVEVRHARVGGMVPGESIEIARHAVSAYPKCHEEQQLIYQIVKDFESRGHGRHVRMLEHSLPRISMR